MVTRQEKLAQLQASLQSRLGSHGGGWIPSHARLLGVPPPLPSEAFSSWCWRIITQQRVSLKHIQSALGIANTIAYVDLGNIPIDKEHIATTSMLPLSQIEHFSWMEKSLLSKTEFSFLMFSQQGFQGDPRPIIRYCEACLASDEIPFIRRLWRLGFAYICPTHHSILRDHCPHCGDLLDLSTPGIKRTRSLNMCRQCGKDITAVTPSFLPDWFHYWVDIKQTELLQLVSCGMPFEDNSYWYPIHSPKNLTVNENRNIDPFSGQTAQTLFQRIVSTVCLVDQAYGSVENAGRMMSQYSRSVSPTGHRTNLPPIPMIDGPSLFKRISPAIALHIHKCQKMPGSTFWGWSPYLDLLTWTDEFRAWMGVAKSTKIYQD